MKTLSKNKVGTFTLVKMENKGEFAVALGAKGERHYRSRCWFATEAEADAAMEEWANRIAA